MLLHFVFASNQLLQISYWVLERNLSVFLGQVQVIERGENWRVEQGTVVKGTDELQEHE